MALAIHGIENPTPADERRALINDFAKRSFRDQADYDYVAARASHRATLMPQFLWSAQQAVEKYLKAILLFNRIPAKNLRHNLQPAVDLINAKARFKLDLSGNSVKLIEYLDRLGRYRYLEVSQYSRGKELVDLDRAVWEIRRYCRVLEYELRLASGSKQMLDFELRKIELSKDGPPQAFGLVDGALEEIIRSRNHPARAALVYNNLYFGASRRKAILIQHRTHATNSPLWLHPEILDDILKYVFLPKDVEAGYRALLASKQASN